MTGRSRTRGYRKKRTTEQTGLTPGQAMDILLEGGCVTDGSRVMVCRGGLICEQTDTDTLPVPEYINSWTLRSFRRA